MLSQAMASLQAQSVSLSQQQARLEALREQQERFQQQNLLRFASDEPTVGNRINTSANEEVLPPCVIPRTDFDGVEPRFNISPDDSRRSARGVDCEDDDDLMQEFSGKKRNGILLYSDQLSESNHMEENLPDSDDQLMSGLYLILLFELY